MFVNMCASWLCCSYSRTLSTQNLLQILWGVLKCETRLYNLGDLGRRMCRDKKKCPFGGVTGLIMVKFGGMVPENEAWTWECCPYAVWNGVNIGFEPVSHGGYIREIYAV